VVGVIVGQPMWCDIKNWSNKHLIEICSEMRTLYGISKIVTSPSSSVQRIWVALLYEMLEVNAKSTAEPTPLVESRI